MHHCMEICKYKNMMLPHYCSNIYTFTCSYMYARVKNTPSFVADNTHINLCVHIFFSICLCPNTMLAFFCFVDGLLCRLMLSFFYIDRPGPHPQDSPLKGNPWFRACCWYQHCTGRHAQHGRHTMQTTAFAPRVFSPLLFLHISNWFL